MHEAKLALTFVELADTLVAEFDLVEFLQRLVERSVELLEISAAGLMLGDSRDHLQVMASSSEEAHLLELYQLQNDEGPCTECFRSGQGVDEPDLQAATERWPRFAPAAVAAGFGSVHALPMRLRDTVVGALNLFGRERGGIPASAVAIGQAMADVATIGMLQERVGRQREVLIEQLHTALDSRVLIEQAKGFLAERHGTTPAQAFTMLREHARSNNRRLTDLAHAVVDRDPTVTALITGAPRPA